MEQQQIQDNQFSKQHLLNCFRKKALQIYKKQQFSEVIIKDPREYLNLDNIQDQESELVQFILQDLICPICQDIVLEPSECNDCSQLVCQDCMQEWIKNVSQCIQCKSEWNPKQKVHRSFIKKRSQLKFKCKCDAFLTFDNYKIHFKEGCVKFDEQNINPCDFIYVYKEQQIDPIISFLLAYAWIKKIQDFQFVYNQKEYKFGLQENGDFSCETTTTILDENLEEIEKNEKFILEKQETFNGFNETAIWQILDGGEYKNLDQLDYQQYEYQLDKGFLLYLAGFEKVVQLYQDGPVIDFNKLNIIFTDGLVKKMKFLKRKVKETKMLQIINMIDQSQFDIIE